MEVLLLLLVSLPSLPQLSLQSLLPAPPWELTLLQMEVGFSQPEAPAGLLLLTQSPTVWLKALPPQESSLMLEPVCLPVPPSSTEAMPPTARAPPILLMGVS